MGTRFLIIVVVVLGVLAYGCERTSTKYCMDPAHFSDHVNCGFMDAAVDAPRTTCASDMDCAGSSSSGPVCDTGNGTCVECLANTDCTTGHGSAVFCNTDTHTCAGCAQHSDCASLACLPDGTCADASTIIYVDGGSGSDTSTCTQAQPCKTITRGLAVAGARTYFKLTGAIMDTVSITSGTWVFLADPMITSLTAVTNTVALTLKTCDVTIWDLAIIAAVQKGAIVGMMPTIRIHRSSIEGAGAVGITMMGGSINLFQCTVANNTGGGITADMNTNFDVENSFIVRNGDGTGVGGAYFGVASAGNNVFQFNTVVDNTGKGDTAAHVSGVGCSATNTLAMPNNIIVRNGAGGSNNTPLLGCSFTGSLLQSDDTGLAFANGSGSSAFDYHLTSGSTAAIDKSTVSSPIDIDVDSQARGSAKDLGADEYVP